MVAAGQTSLHNICGHEEVTKGSCGHNKNCSSRCALNRDYHQKVKNPATLTEGHHGKFMHWTDRLLSSIETGTMM
jgi:hypothetical protein